MKWCCLTLAVVLFIPACAMFGGSDTPAPPPKFQPVEGVLRRAVVAGLTKVDKDAYGGWDGSCPGCDVDAEVFAMLCKEQGLQVSEHHNKQATKALLFAAAQAAVKDMKAGDLFVFYISGHGGQQVDVDGDEADALDETLCLWDGQLTDDSLYSFWQKIPQGVRVFYVTDTCNSGTNYKRRSIKRSIPRSYKGQLIHFGGCDDGQSSYGSASGGVFTTALIDAWKQGISYEEWFRVALTKIGRPQVPSYREYGAVTHEFRSAPALH